MKSSVMNEENRSSNLRETTATATVRITRARAKALGSSSGLPPLHPSIHDCKRILRANSKRAASQINKHETSTAACPQPKKRVALKDVTNVTCENMYINCFNAGRSQPSRQVKKASILKPYSLPKVGDDEDETNIVKVDAQEVESEVNLRIERCDIINTERLDSESPTPMETDSSKGTEENLEDKCITDIDSRHTDPQMCSVYAAEIYTNMYAKQFDRRPMVDYMEKMQHDVSQGMRSILIDWLVEVSEEYRLVPDTLYLTVNLIDRFLSDNYIEKQKLQLLGVTCMLIASKYEEICAPRVEEFCFITDNTYTKEEVMKMESWLLNFLDFQLSVPTTKKFLRRFIQAAQVTYKVPSVELEFLANYLAELTLTEYSFLKFLPSLIAASAVFLARWTLDQSDHPWNPTLEHYTRYKTSELQSVVLELQDLQLNTNGSMLNAIREKYKQSKFKCVSTLRSSKPVASLF